MSGTLNLADGTVETWDVKDVGFVNYFSSGCAIHRIAGGYVADAVMPSIANGSHGCVGIRMGCGRMVLQLVRGWHQRARPAIRGHKKTRRPGEF